MNGVSSLNNDLMSNWWLIDSGASVTVIAKKFLDSFTVVSRMPLCPSERYSAANDTPVTVFERVRVRVKMPLYEGDSYIGMVPVMVTGVVADVGHNILSTEHMVAAGWEVKFSKSGDFASPCERRIGWVWTVLGWLSMDLSARCRDNQEGDLWKDSC